MWGRSCRVPRYPLVNGLLKNCKLRTVSPADAASGPHSSGCNKKMCPSASGWNCMPSYFAGSAQAEKRGRVFRKYLPFRVVSTITPRGASRSESRRRKASGCATCSMISVASTASKVPFKFPGLTPSARPGASAFGALDGRVRERVCDRAKADPDNVQPPQQVPRLEHVNRERAAVERRQLRVVGASDRVTRLLRAKGTRCDHAWLRADHLDRPTEIGQGVAGGVHDGLDDDASVHFEEVPLADEVTQHVQHIVEGARQAKEVFPVDGRHECRPEIADELAANLVAAVLDDSHLFGRRGPTDLAGNAPPDEHRALDRGVRLAEQILDESLAGRTCEVADDA